MPLLNEARLDRLRRGLLPLAAVSLLVVLLFVVAAIAATALMVVLLVWSMSPFAAGVMGLITGALWAWVGLALWMHRSGDHRYGLSLKRLLDAAERGEAEARWRLVEAYRRGTMGLAKDPGQAAWWLRRMADAGDGRAMAELARALWTGTGLARDPRAALELARRAAAAGFAPARMFVPRWEASLADTWSVRDSPSA